MEEKTYRGGTHDTDFDKGDIGRKPLKNKMLKGKASKSLFFNCVFLFVIMFLLVLTIFYYSTK